MTNQPQTEHKSAERLAFEHYIRTGHRLLVHVQPDELEHKFNPYHDPRNGQFTFAPGGPHSLGTVIISDRRGLHRVRQDAARPSTTADGLPSTDPSSFAGVLSDAVYRPSETTLGFEQAQYRPNPRVRIGNNGGPRLNDPLTLGRVFPGLAASPGGSLVAIADNILDLTGPASRLTSELAEAHVNRLIGQMRTIDPNYRLDSLAFPTTLEGQVNLIRQLRVDRATAFYRERGEVRPLQVEVLRYLQERTDKAYEQGLRELDSGRLQIRLSRAEALGNYVDRTVRRDLQKLYNTMNIQTSNAGPIRIIGREYDSSGSDRSYRIPDARVGNIAFDISLTRKTYLMPQVQGFFASDWKPDAVIIVRPRQVGPNNTYAITKRGR